MKPRCKERRGPVVNLPRDKLLKILRVFKAPSIGITKRTYGCVESVTHFMEISPFHDVNTVTYSTKDHNVNLMDWDA